MTNVAMATLLKLWVLKFVDMSQPIPVHRFSPNIQDMFTPKGSRADYSGYTVTNVAMATLLIFFV